MDSSVIECNAETKQLHPTHLTQGPIAHRYFWGGGQARFPALSFSPQSTYSRWDSLLRQYLSCRGIRPPLNLGLMTVLSQPGQFSAFDNFLPSFFNHEWKTEKCHECANMEKVERLKLWWQYTNVCVLYRNVYTVYLLTYSMEQSPSWEVNWFCS